MRLVALSYLNSTFVTSYWRREGGRGEGEGEEQKERKRGGGGEGRRERDGFHACTLTPTKQHTSGKLWKYSFTSSCVVLLLIPPTKIFFSHSPSSAPPIPPAPMPAPIPAPIPPPIIGCIWYGMRTQQQDRDNSCIHTQGHTPNGTFERDDFISAGFGSICKWN